MVSDSIKDFLLKKQEKHDLSRNQIAELCGISVVAVHKLLHTENPSPTLSTVMKIADAFSSSINEVIGYHGDKITGNYKNISVEEASTNLKQYIREKLNDNHMRPSQLSKTLGIGMDTVKDFIIPDSKKKSLSTLTLAKLSQHWQVSIDEMIGRTSPSKEKNVTVEQTQNQTFDTKLTKDDLSALKNIKANLKAKVSVEAEPVQKTTQKPKSFVERLQQERLNKNQKLER